jgi:hypothetical protein
LPWPFPSPRPLPRARGQGALAAFHGNQSSSPQADDQARRPGVALLILDGWGYREDGEDNAIALARTPVFDRLWAGLPRTLVRTSGAAVGLPGGQMGNSEVGHLNIGAGRVVYQEFTRVSRAIRTGSFFSNRTLTDCRRPGGGPGGAVHIMGLLSPGGVHSHEEHLQAMVRLASSAGPGSAPARLPRRPRHPAAQRPASLEAMDAPSRSSAAGVSPPSSAATTPWTATTAGRASRRPTT